MKKRKEKGVEMQKEVCEGVAPGGLETRAR